MQESEDRIAGKMSGCPGVRLMISLVEQLGGTIELDRMARTTFTIVVKEKE
jgi:two-component sensor histidine kinase